MEDMERELQCLRQQMAGTANGKRPHPQCNTQQTLSEGTKRKHCSLAWSGYEVLVWIAGKPAKRGASSSSVVTSPIAMTTNSSAMSSMATRGARSAKSSVHDRAMASQLIAQRKSDKESNVQTDVFSGIRIRCVCMCLCFA